MKIAVVGVTGLVGRKITEVLDERKLAVSSFVAVASEKSIGKKIMFQGKAHSVVSLRQAVDEKPDIAIFSAGSAISLQWASVFAQNGTRVIDNSSAWRTNKNVPLVVSEINGEALGKNDFIIANPNCSTIQLVMVLFPLHRKFKIKRVVVATYQSVTGSGAKGLRQIEAERQGKHSSAAYPHPIFNNVLPQAGEFVSDGYTSEEIKLINETRKILNNNSLAIAVTAARVPVTGGHSEAVNIVFEKKFDLEDVYCYLREMPGVEVIDNPADSSYPMPIFTQGKDAVFVGRIRRDFSIKNGLNLWITADNLRKGAATNTVQIAEILIEKGFF